MKSIKYEDLVVGQIYVGQVVGCTVRSVWLFKYSGLNINSKALDQVNHRGPAVHLINGSKKSTEVRVAVLHSFSTWDFRPASYEEIILLEKCIYEIY